MPYLLLTDFDSEAFCPVRRSQRFLVVRKRKPSCPQQLAEIRSFLHEEGTEEKGRRNAKTVIYSLISRRQEKLSTLNLEKCKNLGMEEKNASKK